MLFHRTQNLYLFVFIGFFVGLSQASADCDDELEAFKKLQKTFNQSQKMNSEDLALLNSSKQTVFRFLIRLENAHRHFLIHHFGVSARHLSKYTDAQIKDEVVRGLEDPETRDETRRARREYYPILHGGRPVFHAKKLLDLVRSLSDGSYKESQRNPTYSFTGNLFEVSSKLTPELLRLLNHKQVVEVSLGSFEEMKNPENVLAFAPHHLPYLIDGDKTVTVRPRKRTQYTVGPATARVADSNVEITITDIKFIPFRELDRKSVV
jgi:hypothetical protein